MYIHTYLVLPMHFFCCCWSSRDHMSLSAVYLGKPGCPMFHLLNLCFFADCKLSILWSCSVMTHRVDWSANSVPRTTDLHIWFNRNQLKTGVCCKMTWLFYRLLAFMVLDVKVLSWSYLPSFSTFFCFN